MVTSCRRERKEKEKKRKRKGKKRKKKRDSYESVAARFARLTVGDDDGLVDLAVDVKVIAEAGVGGVVGQAADEDLGEGRVFDRRRRCAAGRR